MNSHAKIIASLSDAFMVCNLKVPDQLGRIIGLSIELMLKRLHRTYYRMRRSKSWVPLVI